MKNQTTGTIYISYTLTDYRQAASIGDVLAQQGYSVLLTPYHNTAFGAVVITDHMIRRADKVICICSPTALRSNQVWQDMAMTRLWEKPVIPVLVKDFPDHTPLRHYIDAVDDEQAAMVTLLKSLKKSRQYKSNSLNDSALSFGFKVAVRASAVAAIISAMMLLGSGII